MDCLSSAETLMVGLVLQLSRRLAHVQLARHHVCDEPGAVLQHQLDLATGADDGGILSAVALRQGAGQIGLIGATSGGGKR